MDNDVQILFLVILKNTNIEIREIYKDQHVLLLISADYVQIAE